MSEWNAMTYEGKDTILRVVRHEAEQLFALAEEPGAWDRPTACQGWSTRDVVGHIVDTTEGYFAGFDAARGKGEVPAPYGLPAMHDRVNEMAVAFRRQPQAWRALRRRWARISATSTTMGFSTSTSARGHPRTRPSCRT